MIFLEKRSQKGQSAFSKKARKNVAVYNTFFSMYDKLKKVLPEKLFAYAGYRTQYLQLFVRLLSKAYTYTKQMLYHLSYTGNYKALHPKGCLGLKGPTS